MRYFQVKNRVLYYYLSEELSSREQPKGSMSLSDAKVSVPTHTSYPYYFIVTDNQSGLALKLQARRAAPRGAP